MYRKVLVSILLTVLSFLVTVPILAQDQDINVCWLENNELTSLEGLVIDTENVQFPREPLNPEINNEREFEGPFLRIYSFDIQSNVLIFAGRIDYGHDVGQSSGDSDGDGIDDYTAGWEPDWDEGLFRYNFQQDTIETIWIPGNNYGMPENVDISPNGTRVVFTAAHFAGNTPGRSEIFMLNLQGDLTLVTENDLIEENPFWVNNSEVIYSQRDIDGTVIYLLDIMTSETQLLFENEEPSFLSPFAEEELIYNSGIIINYDGETVGSLEMDYPYPIFTVSAQEESVLVSTFTSTFNTIIGNLYLNGEVISSSENFHSNPRFCPQ